MSALIFFQNIVDLWLDASFESGSGGPWPGKTKATWKGMRNEKSPNQLIFEIGK